ncbi:efflux RND transporter periplasmic adaptor subunit [Reyranella massiliensis]|uniref:efflux RND transporter periplasmic adaptor subunit n=1 Tax=Reyranella massiliensis TaxID=445220 RepID=UPI000A016869|nr:HlyD family efflux transporter periplasmic adaptor subunit [Reyranella massiliensis]
MGPVPQPARPAQGQTPPQAPLSAPAQVGRLNQQLLRMTEVLQLAARARDAGREELPFVIVNETVRAVAYDQAVLWDARTERVVALSGAARLEAGAPYVLLLERLYRSVVSSGKRDEVQKLGPEAVKGDEEGAKAWLAPHLLWWPLRVRGNTVAILMLGRRTAWQDNEQPLLNVLCGSYGQAWELARARLAPVKLGGRRKIKRIAIAAVIALLVGAGLVPVRSSAIAPADVVAETPAFVRAPFAGVVDAIEVAPNAQVKTGQLIVRLERRQLDAEYKVAAKVLETATAQFRQTSQEAITDPRAREQLATLRARLDEARADFDYRQARLGRADILSPADGIAVFNDPAEWIGKPVEVGERILQVSPPTSSRIEIELPVTEATSLEEGAEVTFFSNLTPDRPVTGKVVFVSYATTVTPSGVLAYTARADLAGGADLRLGLKGTAKIFGPPRPLAVWLLRRPLAYLRQLVA